MSEMTNPRVPATEADRIAAELDKLSSSHRPLLDAAASLIHRLAHQPSVDREAHRGEGVCASCGVHGCCDCVAEPKCASCADAILALASSAPAVAIPAGMKPWHGGDSAPQDAMSPLAMRDGKTWNCLSLTRVRWTHVGDGSDIIAYTPTRDESGLRDALRAEIINTPETADFMAGVPLEAAHQRERWGSDHDAGKSPEDWFWLLGYLGQKALRAQNAGDTEKALHHTISTAAALANWHAAISGTHTAMRPGIEPPALATNGGAK